MAKPARISTGVALFILQAACGGGSPPPAGVAVPADIPVSMTFTSQPTGTMAGAPFGVALLVTDAHADPIPGAAVTLALNGNGTGAELGGNVSVVTDASGAASFLGLTITKSAQGYAILASAVGARATSTTFDITPAALSLADSTVTASPETVDAGGRVATIAIRVVDSFRNPIPDFSVTITSSVPGDTFFQPDPTNADGATSTGFVGYKSGLRTFTATAGGLPLLQTPAITVTPSAPERLWSGLSPRLPGPVADGNTPAVFDLLVYDAFVNRVPGVAVTFSTSAGTLAFTTATTDAAGEATITLTSTVAGPATVTATVTGWSVQATTWFSPGPLAP